MPIPQRGEKEDKDAFMQRCMSSDVMNKEYPDNKQRVAICISQANLSHLEAADMALTYSKKKFKYKNPKTNEFYFYDRKGVYKKDGVTLIPDDSEED